MHTIKAAVIELDADSRGFDIDAFRQVIAGRMDKLEPLGYQLIDIPLKFHHPMWRENCEVDFNYHIRPWQAGRPGWSPRTGRGDRTDRQHPAGSCPPAVGDVLRRGPGQRPDRGGGQDPPRTRRRRRFGEPDGPRHGPDADAAARLIYARSGAHHAAADGVGVRGPPAPHRADPRDDPLHRAGRRPGATQLAQALTGTDHAIHAASRPS